MADGSRLVVRIRVLDLYAQQAVAHNERPRPDGTLLALKHPWTTREEDPVSHAFPAPDEGRGLVVFLRGSTLDTSSWLPWAEHL